MLNLIIRFLASGLSVASMMIRKGLITLILVFSIGTPVFPAMAGDSGIRDSAASCQVHSGQAASLEVRHLMRALCDTYWRATVASVREAIACSYDAADKLYDEKKPQQEQLNMIMSGCD